MKTATKTIVGLIALLWVWSGALKLLAPDAFSAVLDAHGVISDGLILVTARGVPFIEICLGLGFAWTFGHRVSTLRLLVASLVLVSVFSMYLAVVPVDSIQAVGCGCQAGTAGPRSFAESLGMETRTAALVFNALLTAAHLVLILVIARTRVMDSGNLSASKPAAAAH
jgi:hypothetical protein